MIKNQIKQLGYFIDQKIKIPQDYSFLIFGSHGTGLHSLMYFISLLGQNSIYPVSMFALRSDIDRWGKMVSLRFYTQIFKKIRSNPRITKWGLTFDGGPTDYSWISKNIVRVVPSIFLVRDPIQAIVSHMNYRMFADVYLRDKINDVQYYYDMIVKNSLELHMTCGFYTNMKKVEKYIGKRIYFDTSDLIGNVAKETMKKIANFLDVCYEERCEFGMGINTPFTRYFPLKIKVDNIKFKITPFDDMFEHGWYPKYCEQSTMQKIEEFCFQQKLFVFTSARKKISQKTMEKVKVEIDCYLEKLEKRIEIFEQKKIRVDDFFYCVNKDVKYQDDLKSFLKDEVVDVVRNCPRIVEKWKIFLDFIKE